MNKKAIIISILITLLLMSSLIVFRFDNKKEIYITKSSEIKNTKLSMIKIEEGISTVIKAVPTSGNWYMDYNCENDNTKLFWDDDSKKILVKEAGDTECTVIFEKTKSAINIVSMYVDDVYVGELEESKSYRLLSYECANGETVMWNGIESEVSVKPLRQNTHCKLYFEEAPYLYNKILLDNVVQSDSSINFANSSSDTNGKGLYYTENELTYGEDNTRIYYFRGRVENNWASFGGYLWRIVRTTSENGIKLVYSGNGQGTTSGHIKSVVFNTTNNRYRMGYTYNLTGYSGNQTDSLVKTEIDSWYESNLSSYSNYLSETAVYCSDRDGSSFPVRVRLYANKRPSFACPNANESRYTASITTGNGYLQKPIALLTADEVHYSGVIYGTKSLNSYIMDNVTEISNWWLISPFSQDVRGGGWWCLFSVRPGGDLYDDAHVNSGAVRPSVSLKSCIVVTSGDGTLSSPYILSDKAC